MSRLVPANRLDQAVSERAKELRAAGASYRAIQAQLEREGESASLAALHEACKDVAPAPDGADPEPPEAHALARDLEDAAGEALETLRAGTRAIQLAIMGGTSAQDLAKLLTACGKETERAVKLAQLLRGKATSRSASVSEPSETDAQRAAREKLERLAGLAEGAG